LLSTKEIRKKVSISEVQYFIKSLQSPEILLQFIGFDFRLIFDTSEDFCNLLKMRFVVMCPQKTLFVFGVPNSSLKDFRSPAKKNVYAFDATPED